MAQVYSSMTTWPQRWFELYHQVLRKKGVHYTFTEGRTSDKPSPNDSILVKPFYVGYTMRAFYFAGKKEGETHIGVWYDGAKTWKAGVIVKDGVASTYVYKGATTKVGDVNVGDIYTAALRTEDKINFKISFNEEGFHNGNFQDISDKWKFQVWESSGNHSILSMHFYNETQKDTPHLGDRLYLNDLRLPVGAYGTYAVAYTGTTEAVIVTAIQDPDKMNFTFENNGRLNKDDIFHCIVRITAYGLAVSVSFDPDHQFQPAVNPVIWLRCCFDYGSIQNAHIVSPW